MLSFDYVSACLRAAAQAWQDFVLAEIAPAGQNLERLAGQVPLLVDDLPEAAHIRDALTGPGDVPPRSIAVDLYLGYLKDQGCDPEAWEAEGRYRLALAVRDVLPRLRPLYQAAVAAAAGVDVHTNMRALQQAYEKEYAVRLAQALPEYCPPELA